MNSNIVDTLKPHSKGKDRTPGESALPGGRRVRCPYCGAMFEPDGRARCASCGRAILLPGFYKTSARRGGRARPWTPKTSTRALTPRIAFGRSPLRLLLVFAFLFVAAGLLLSRARHPADPNPAHRLALARLNIETLGIALAQLRRDCGRYPTSAEGLVALIHDPRMPDWKGPYIFELKPDPWGRTFRYAVEGETATVHSAGPDGIDGTGDDLSHHPNLITISSSSFGSSTGVTDSTSIGL